MNGPEDEGDGVIQRRVHAADASPLRSPVASSVFNWRGAGSTTTTAEPDPDPEAAGAASQPPQEEEQMATNKKRDGRARKPNGNPQQVVCCALRAAGHLSRAAIADACSALTATQISQALNYLKKHERVEHVEDGEGGKAFQLTEAGEAWLAAALGEQPAQATAKPKRGAAGRSKAHARRPVRTKDAPAEPVASKQAGAPAVDPSFRCAVISDGGFWITKQGVELELTVDEHRHMVRYQERMAEIEAD
jgi:hypothetical protein